MLTKLFPKEKDFFPVFNQMTLGLSAAISELLGLIDHPENIEKAVLRTRALDLQAERLARQSIEHLHETFITPFDRRYIFQFVTQLGQINTLARIITEKLQAYELRQLPLELIEMTAQCGEACSILKQMVVHLRKIKHPGETLKLCLNIYKIRSTSEVLFFKVSKDLYSSELEMKSIMKLKEVSEDFVSIVRKFEGISFLIEEIILEYA